MIVEIKNTIQGVHREYLLVAQVKTKRAQNCQPIQVFSLEITANERNCQHT